jgi:hypothetical protein
MWHKRIWLLSGLESTYNRNQYIDHVNTSLACYSYHNWLAHGKGSAQSLSGASYLEIFLVLLTSSQVHPPFSQFPIYLSVLCFDISKQLHLLCMGVNLHLSHWKNIYWVCLCV